MGEAKILYSQVEVVLINMDLSKDAKHVNKAKMDLELLAEKCYLSSCTVVILTPPTALIW